MWNYIFILLLIDLHCLKHFLFQELKNLREVSEQTEKKLILAEKQDVSKKYDVEIFWLHRETAQCVIFDTV